MAERSKELIQVGYYLSKYRKQGPPERLETDKWCKAYRLFYDALNGGRAVLEFEHSLKNSRGLEIAKLKARGYAYGLVSITFN